MDILNDVVMPLIGSPWIYLVVLLSVAGDGFVPPIPGETLVIPLAALAASQGAPDPLLLIAFASAGSFIGDSIAFWIGRLFGREGISRLKLGFIPRMISWAEQQLMTRPAMILIPMRFVPGCRIAVNIAAGISGFPYRTFALWCVISGIFWGILTVTVGYLAGSWFRDNPLHAVLFALALAVSIGWLLDFTTRRWRREA